MCKKFAITDKEAAKIVLDFSMHKQGKAMTARLFDFVQTLKILPVSSAACERGFSQMNLHHTAVRNRLAIITISNLLMISINGPSEQLECQKICVVVAEIWATWRL